MPRTQLRHRPSGFALVVVLTLLMLLTIIAVGFLSLSTVTLRSSNQAEAMATARANARMALVMAIGELQKSAGPDQRITARADVINEKSANPRLTGVWKSWEIKASAPPTAADYDKPERDKKFLGWLASCADGTSSSKIDFANQATSNPAILWGEGSLGKGAAVADVVKASIVPMLNARGAFAWAVMDEGVKVRINTPYLNGATVAGEKTSQLGSGTRPNTSSIKNLEKLVRPWFEQSSTNFAVIEKGITKLNFGLAAETLAAGTANLLKPLSHDVTSLSVGLFTDTASGGFKEDFSLLSSAASLPTTYSKKGVYASRLGMTGVSDPQWDSLQQFANIYKDATRLSTFSGVPLLKAQGPKGWTAATGSNPSAGTPGTIVLTPPSGVVLMPTIAKVQIVFSLLTRDIYSYPKVSDTTPKNTGSKEAEMSMQMHYPWAANFAGTSYDYLLHLLYTPVVTLHNPYNVALEFSELKVVFGNVPFALQVFRNGTAQTKAPAPLDTMFYQGAELGQVNKRFGMVLKTNGGTSSTPAVGSTTFRLLPGEVMMFSPYIPPSRTWADEYSSGTRIFQDWDNDANRTMTMDAIPGWRGDGIGFDLDWFCPSYNGLRITSNETENGNSMDRGGCIGARAADNFSLKFAPLSVTTLSKNKFTIEVFARRPGSSTPVSSAVIEMDYEKPTGLQDTLLGPGGTITFPKTGTINTMAMHSHSTTAIKNIATVKPFAVISAQSKTTTGGLNPDGEDGKLATKPWCFAHGVIGASSHKFISQHPANASHELALQRLDHGTNNLLQFDPKTGRGNFITGLTGSTGIKFASLYDIPLAPIQTLASLNGANPGGSSGYLPRFAQPIGNSWAHPLLKSSELKTGNYLDHSFLLNLALYDHFYLSGLADQTGPFGTAAKTTSSLVQNFITGKCLSDPRITLHTPDGKLESQLATDVTASDAYARIASWQLMNGAFNVNSTSVAAWKAMLGSIHDGQAIFNKINKTAIPSKSAFTSLTATDSTKNEVRISRFRLPASESDKNAADPKDAYWLGPRNYSDAELQLLAEKIVEQVRLRGPFLSMAEFVNRRLGNGETAQRGALQQAIDNTNLNQSLATSTGAGFEIPEQTISTYKYQNTTAGTGSSFQGAPGYLTQADLLNVLGNAATPRSDTFTIRGYGDARDASNKPIATATCEAVIQRVPEFVDPADKSDTPLNSLTSKTNKMFGRRFQIISFRWLAPNEI